MEDQSAGKDRIMLQDQANRATTADLPRNHPKRVVAGALDWPGLDRGGRDEAAALEALLSAGPRYKEALGPAARGLRPPKGVDGFEVVERHKGDSGTEFGIPSSRTAADAKPVSPAAVKRLTAIFRAAWTAFDAAAAAAEGAELRKGPRGGGRALPKIVEHVLGGEGSYVYQIGGKAITGRGDEMARIRAAAVEALRTRARNEPFEMGRRTAPLWTPRSFVRRSAWHALDHAWEIEDRAER